MKQQREAESHAGTARPRDEMENSLYQAMEQSFNAAYSRAGQDMSKASEVRRTAVAFGNL
jgi:hypothetical protein